MQIFLSKSIRNIIIFFTCVLMISGCDESVENNNLNMCASINVLPLNEVINSNENIQLKALCVYHDGKSIRNITNSVTWTSSAPSCATISSTGLATAQNTESQLCITNIKATAKNGISGQAPLKVNGEVLTSFVILPPNPTLHSQSNQQFEVSATCSNSPCTIQASQLNWFSNNLNCATIVESGSIGGLATGDNLGGASPCTSEITAIANPSTQCSGTGCIAHTTLSVTGNLVSFTVTPNPGLILTANGTLLFTAQGACLSGPCTIPLNLLSWTSSVPTCATINNLNGQATGTNVTTFTCSTLITVTADPSTGCLGANCSVIVPLLVGGQILDGLTISPVSSTITYDALQTYTLVPTCTPGPCTIPTSQLSWTSSDSTCATIPSSGNNMESNTATGVNLLPELCTVTITATALPTTGCSCGNCQATATLNVTGNLQQVVITPNPPMMLTPNGSLQLSTSTSTCSNGECTIPPVVSWQSSESTCATVDANGLATGTNTTTGPCTTTITATANPSTGCVGVNNCTATVTLTVAGQTLTSLTISPTSSIISFDASQLYMLTATCSPGPACTIPNSQLMWTSSATTCATIPSPGNAEINTATGVNTLPQECSTTITATADPSTGCNNCAPTAILDVKGNLFQVVVTPNPGNIPTANGTLQFTTATSLCSNRADGTVTCTEAPVVSWQSSAPTCATIDATTGLATGTNITTESCTTTITATADPSTGCAGVNNCTTTVTLSVVGQTLVSLAISPTSSTIVYNGTQAYTLTPTCASGPCTIPDNQISWTSIATNCATIPPVGSSESNTATGANTLPQECPTTITATAAPSTGCSGGGCEATATLSVTGTLLSIAVSPNPANIPTPNGTEQFTADGTCTTGPCIVPLGSINWSSSNTSCATVNGTGFATGNNAGSSNCGTNIIATVNPSTGCVGGNCTGQAALTVDAPILISIEVSPNSAQIYQGANPGIPQSKFFQATSVPSTGSQQYTATGIYNFGPNQDITSQVMWQSNNLGAATITSPGGFAQAVLQGNGYTGGIAPVTITASLNAVSGSATLTVVELSGSNCNITGLGCTLPCTFQGQMIIINCSDYWLIYADGSQPTGFNCSNWHFVPSGTGPTVVQTPTGAIVTCGPVGSPGALNHDSFMNLP